ncbi:MALE DISCOVERER 1-like protein [Drosera capensis]
MSFLSFLQHRLVEKSMGGRWNTCGLQFICFVVLFLTSGLRGCSSLNLEGLHLLKFRGRVYLDPHNAFASWNPDDGDPCMWFGVHCIDGKVQMLNLSGLSLEGVLPPELGDLSDLRVIRLYRNRFSGVIPNKLGNLKKLELLDLRENNLTGNIPAEIGTMASLQSLLLCGNKFEGNLPQELGELNFLSELQFDHSLISVSASEIGCINRKIVPRPTSRANSLHILEEQDPDLQRPQESTLAQNVESVVSVIHRVLLEESRNLKALSVPSSPITPVLSSHSSGTFPAISNASDPLPTPAPDVPASETNDTSPTPNSHSVRSKKIWIYVAIGLGVALLLAVLVTSFLVCKTQGVKPIEPWKTGLSGQLQKAFVTGVPKLNRSELETACEDFSNIIETFDECVMYKGTLSSGVEIAVVSTTITSAKDWSEEAEISYREKIETLSRVNHKNFINLIGHCEEEEPFSRMMVFEYVSNGSLFEHLHVKEMEHLDWRFRMRIIMGTAYCLQYMHELNPPVAHSNLNSTNVYLTDDYAAKIGEVTFSEDMGSKTLTSGEDEQNHEQLPLRADPQSTIYSFGVMLLETISGRLPYSEEQGSLVNWATEYLGDKQKMSSIVDPTLKCFIKSNELEILCEVILDCIKVDPKERLPMSVITSKLKEVISITPDAAVPRLSPLWWAELEILSVEAA